MANDKESESNIYKISEGCYLKEKSWFNQPEIIYPVRDLESKKIIWKNLIMGGSWLRFIEMCIILLIIVFSIWAYKHDTAECLKVIENPCKYCVGTAFNYSIVNTTLQQSLKEPPKFGLDKVHEGANLS